MSVRAGIVVTGTEVLTGRITDQNGPWVAQRLLEAGVDVAHITICGDRPADLTAQLRFLIAEGVDLIVTTGGLGPTADDLTVDTVAELLGRPLALDAELESRITEIIARWQRHALETDAVRAGIRKQALVPSGAESIPPTGTAPGVAIPRTTSTPTVVILPGPPRELQAMWPAALVTRAMTQVMPPRVEVRQEVIRAYGLSEAELAESLREAEHSVAGFGGLEITTCMRRGEIDMVTRFPDEATPAYRDLSALLDERHGAQIFSTTESTLDDLLAHALTGVRIATAESCTGGLVAARLTDRAGSSAYVWGGVVSYSNDVKTDMLDVPATMIAEHGAVSEQVARAMADGARRRLGADIAVSTTGIAGPDGGSTEKPVGTVCFGLSIAGRTTATRTRRFPGDRATVRALATTAALHLVLDALKQEN
ncbi:competence/damage-inducible protein A [Gordonia sp. ABSL1-1]|uniref:competence/damage-inducible protein A n=1 Tax=Gordonia sp. ABSL1-1 TaxID=3053923 RepID=UPI002572B743|nr:competence/damage-inducible protein A [Gordonia sp. ABSL1-1]MDL9935256.1 competence/damage-inducible protein A [Gordonia sp. ABSL1-1]